MLLRSRVDGPDSGPPSSKSPPVSTSMASPQDSPRQRRGVRSYFRELVRSHSRSPSHQPAAVALSSSGSPAPNQESSWTIGNLLAPPSPYRGELRHARSDSQLTQNSIPVIQVGSGGTIWTGLRAALEELGGASGMFPPLRSAIGSLISCLGLLEVWCYFAWQGPILIFFLRQDNVKEPVRIRRDCIRAQEPERISDSAHERLELNSHVKLYSKLCTVSMPAAPIVSDSAPDDVYRSIEQQAKLINAKSSRGSISRIAEASIEEEELTRCYRKIDWLFRQLQVSWSYLVTTHSNLE